MKHQKMFSLVNGASNSKFVERKQNSFNDQSDKNYDIGNDIIDSTLMLISKYLHYLLSEPQKMMGQL